MPLAFALLLLAAIALLEVAQLPAQEARREEARADIAAASFLAYREAVLDHLNANPGFVGTVADAALLFPWGHVRDARWSHLAEPAGTLYVYQASGAAPPLLLDTLQRRTGNSFLLGRAGGGQLVTASGVTVAISVPTAVPAGAVVLVGR